MQERFEGKDGNKQLTKVLADQRLVQHDEAIARKLADMVKVANIPEGNKLYVGGEQGRNILFLILSGSFDLLVKDKPVATLGAEQFIGEFPILNSSLDYTVCAVARENSVVASLTEPQLLELTKVHPEIWRSMAKELAVRLRNAAAARQLDPLRPIKPGEVPFWEILKSLTTPQVVGILAGLSFITSAAYKMGVMKLLGQW